MKQKKNIAGFTKYNVRKENSPNPSSPYIDLVNQLIENSIHTGWTAKADTRIYQCQFDYEIPGYTFINDNGNLMRGFVKSYKKYLGLDIHIGELIPAGLPLPDPKIVLQEIGFKYANYKEAQDGFRNDFLINFFGNTIPESNTTELYSNLNSTNGHKTVLPIVYKNIVNNPNGELFPLEESFTQKGASFNFYLSYNIFTRKANSSIDYGNSTLDSRNAENYNNAKCPLIGAALPWFVTYLNK